MVTVDKLLADKRGVVWYVEPQTPVRAAVALMAEKGIGALVVLQDDHPEGKLAGIVSERDCARGVIAERRDPDTTTVGDIMTRQVFYTTPEEDVNTCLATMTRHHIRHLPVMEHERVVAVITMGDVVKEILAAQQNRIEHLERYMSWEETF